jgi:small-conductance mechanosensitive channel
VGIFFVCVFHAATAPGVWSRWHVTCYGIRFYGHAQVEMKHNTQWILAAALTLAACTVAQAQSDTRHYDSTMASPAPALGPAMGDGLRIAPPVAPPEAVSEGADHLEAAAAAAPAASGDRSEDRASGTDENSSTAPATPAPDDSSAPPAAAAPVETSPLVRNGLLDQAISRIGWWFSGLADQTREAGQAALRMRTLGSWWARTFATPESRAAALCGTGVGLAILLAAALLEAALHWALRRTRHKVEAGAHRQAALASSKPTESAPDAGAVPRPADPAAARFFERHKILRNRGLLRRIPYAFAHAFLNLIPLAAFVVATSLSISSRVETGSTLYNVLVEWVDAYVSVRIALTVVRLMASPKGQSLRLLHMSDETAAYVTAWARALVIVAVFGTALASVLGDIGIATSFRTLVLKIVGLAVHLMLIVVIVQKRGAVAAVIRGTPATRARVGAALANARGVLADIWAVLAVFLVFALWLVWALGVDDGFQRILHFAAVTAAVLVGMRLFAIVAQGAIDSAFSHAGADAAEGAAATATATAEGVRYRNGLHVLLRVLLGLVTLALLLEVWGVPALCWFGAGTVGRRFAQAALTIALAAFLAVLAWEAAGYAVRRRIARWTARGDMVRVARLRTLMPMMRTLLLAVIGVIVILTALNQLGVNTAPLVAGASIIGVALGFGSQKLVQDFITGLFLMMENAMQVGDWVTVAGVSGSVEYLSIRTVRLRAGDGSLHVVPFSSVTTVNNVNRGVGNAAIRVSVTASSDIGAVFDELAAIGKEMRADEALGKLILADTEIWGVDQIDGHTVTISGQIRTLDRGRWPVQRAFNRRVLERFRERGIALANPQETLMLTPAPGDRAADPVQGSARDTPSAPPAGPPASSQ